MAVIGIDTSMSDDNSRNVLFIVLDTVRASSTAVDGREITPTIAGEMDRGATFTRAIAPTPWSLSSHASMWTGKYASEHGATLTSQHLPADQPTLAERLSEEGYRTGIFTANLFTSAAFGMDRGFDTTSFALNDRLFDGGISIRQFMLRHSWESKAEFASKLVRECASQGLARSILNLLHTKYTTLATEDVETDRKDWDDAIVEDARQFIQKQGRGEDPFFGFVNILAAHGPWEYDPKLLREIGVNPSDYGTPDEWEYLASVSESQWPYAAGELAFSEREVEMLTHLYESWVYRADQYAAELLEMLDQEGLREETTVILTADHGEAVCEDGVLGHTISLQENCVRVPLTISGPDVRPQTVDQPVSLKNLFGTVLQVSSASTDRPSVLRDDAQGQALTETYGVDRSDIGKHVEEVIEDAERFTHLRRALWDGDAVVHRCPDTGGVDGDESLLPVLDELLSTLDIAEMDRRDDGVDRATQERLEYLGYVQ